MSTLPFTYIFPDDSKIDSPDDTSYVIAPANAAEALRASEDDLDACQAAVRSAEGDIENRTGRLIRSRTAYYDFYYKSQYNFTRLLLKGGPFEFVKLEFIDKDNSVISDAIMDLNMVLHGNNEFPDFSSLRLPQTDAFEARFTDDNAVIMRLHVKAGWANDEIPKSLYSATLLMASSLYDKGHARTEYQISYLIENYIVIPISFSS